MYCGRRGCHRRGGRLLSCLILTPGYVVLRDSLCHGDLVPLCYSIKLGRIEGDGRCVEETKLAWIFGVTARFRTDKDNFVISCPVSLRFVEGLLTTKSDGHL
jgi:hypothetical protein